MAVHRGDLNPLQWKGDCLTILDQTKLPARVTRRVLKNSTAVAEAIKNLQVRGAPLIGIAAAYGAVLAFREIAEHPDPNSRLAQWKLNLQKVEAARPTAVNLREAIRRMERAGEKAMRSTRDPAHILRQLEAQARQIEREEVERCLRIGAFGATVVPERSRVLTICNTGALATGGIGTALGVIRTAHEQGKIAQVWVPETRPLLQGSRLTAWELAILGIPFRILADAAVGTLFDSGVVDLVIVGADRIALNGDFANKVGTLPIFMLAKNYGVPAFVAAPLSTFDPNTPDGKSIPIETRPEEEVLTIGGLRIAPDKAQALNPAFDVTPANLVTAYITDRGVFTPVELKTLWKLLSPSGYPSASPAPEKEDEDIADDYSYPNL